MKWIKRKAVLEKLGVSPWHLQQVLEGSPGFPAPVRLSERVTVYEEGAIEEWMKRMSSNDVNAITMEV